MQMVLSVLPSTDLQYIFTPTQFPQSRLQYHTPQSQNNFIQQSSSNPSPNYQRQTTSRPHDNIYQNYDNLLEKVKQLENQVHTLTTRISQLENNPKQYETKFSNIENQVNNIATNTGQDRPGPKDRLTILTDNISKLSNAIYTKDKPIKQSKRSSPYEKTSYEQTKKKHYTRSSNKSSSPRISADDSDSFPQTEDDTIMHQDLTALTDNAADDGIIEPDSDYTQNDNISGTLSYGYNIFNFGSRK
ncbi:hypothetical protein GLOIN_2v1481287 [Rhizophagus irregularis DAOM 181602=DAOM 197198]|nr:hypothetical protein GLOIN_2v1481287 [Rhizophagus irregularis DAOM 181602=DAOM 197198]